MATGSALKNRATSAAITDYISRLVKAYSYLRAHPQLVIRNVYEKQYGLTAARAAAVSATIGPSSFFTLPGTLAAEQQQLANLFTAAGAIPGKINVGQEFNPRYNSVISSVQGS